MKTSLRALWRALDELPAGFEITRLADLSDAHGELLRRDLGVLYSEVTKIIFANCQHHGLRPLNWPASYAIESAIIETIDDVTTRRIYRAIKSEVRTIKEMWLTGDSLLKGDSVPAGTDLDAHAFLLKFYDDHVQPLPSAAWDVPGRIRKGLLIPAYRVPGMDGLANTAEQPTEAIGGLSEALRWQYPTAWETTTFLLLLLVLTGWNLDTALNLNLEGDWCRTHPLNDHLVVLKAKKGKTDKIQTAICLGKPEFYPEQLIRSLVERTEPLRNELRRQLCDIRLRMGSDGKAAPGLQRDHDRLKVMIQSPWIYFNRQDISEIGCLLPWQTLKYPGVVLRAIVAKHDIRAPAGGVVQIKPGDFRDAWIGFSYMQSGYSWLIAKVAAGHNSMDALRNYFRQRRWRAYSEGRVSALLTAIWTEIRGRRLIDGAVLRQMVERGEITDLERERLEQGRSRTRMGTGCRDFLHPPAEIAPGHPTGVGCIVQRCVLCRHALLFADSIDGLCCRKAELEHVCRTMGTMAWFESSFPDEEQALDEALTLFVKVDVIARIEAWRSRIASGQHMVFEFQGYYGASV